MRGASNLLMFDLFKAVEGQDPKGVNLVDRTAELDAWGISWRST